MTISTTSGRIQYEGNDVTLSFATDFKILDETHVKVLLDDTEKTLTTHYTVSGVGNSTATVVMVTEPATGEKLTLVLNPPLTQTTDLVNGQALNADTIEESLDLGVQIDQLLNETLSRTLIVPESVSTSFDGEIPSLTANYILRIDGTATGFEAVSAVDAGLGSSITPTDGTFVVGDGTDFVGESGATARTSMGLGSMSTQAASSVAITGGTITGATDITSTGTIDFGGATSLEIPNSTSLTLDAAGEIGLDTNGDGSTITTGVVRVYDGTQITNVVSSTNYPTANAQIPSYRSATNDVAWQSVEVNTITTGVNQGSHGFSVGDVIRLSGASTYAKALGDSSANAEIVGIVSEVTDTDNFSVATTGRVTGLSGLIADTVYFLSPSTAGALTSTEPSTAGEVSRPVLLADTTTTGYLLHYRGIEVGTELTDLDVDNLNLNGNAITSTDTAGNITITPDTTGDLVLDGLSWPQADGTANYVLETDGAGQLSWVSNAGGGGISNIVDDLTPQLGGHLDVNGKTITSASSGDIAITPDATGDLILDGLSWPQADGTADYVLKTDGLGQLSWVSNAGGGGHTDEEIEDLAGNLVAVGGTKTGITVTYQDATGDMDFEVAIADLTTSGTVELATVAETNTGTDATRAVTPDGLDGWTGSAQVTTVGTLASPTLTTPALGTPASGVLTNCTGTASGLTAGNVTTNANLTGDVTSSGNATTIAAGAVDVAMLANGTDGELITWSATGVAATVAVGTSTHVLTSNGVGVAPTFQAATGGLSNVVEDTTPQLGGNLDVNSNSIVSASAADINITPDTTGSVVLDGLSWPQADGSANQVIETDGAGNLSFVANAGSGIANVVDDTTPQLGGQLDVNGQAIGDGTRELLTFIEDASAVNHVNIENQATGSGPIISSVGDDTNVDLNITPKGTGALVLDGLSWPTADGTANQVIETDGAGALSFVTAGGGGGQWTELSSSTASASASISFTAWSTSYRMYKIVITDLTPAFDGELRCTVSTDGGSTYISSGYSWTGESRYGGSATVRDTNNSSDSYIQLHNTNTGYKMGATTDENQAGEIFFCHESEDFSLHARLNGVGDAAAANSNITTGSAGSSINGVDGIKFVVGAGNIATGVFTLYGLT